MSYILSTLLGVWFLFSSVAHAFTPEWITHQTRGRVKYTQAVELISTINRHAFINEVDPQVVFKLIKIRVPLVCSVESRGYWLHAGDAKIPPR
jgi:hypothetical protein